jgi:hypothetical protein
MNPIRNQLRFCAWDTVRLAAGVGLVWLGLATSSPAQTNIITDCTETALRAALAQGGAISFACDGTITLTGTLSVVSNTIMDGGSHRVTISGGDAVRVLRVSPNISFTAANLTIASGRSDSGAGLYNDGGRLTLRYCIFTNNTCTSEAGALGNYGGEVTLEDCTFGNNTAGGNGGAIANYGTLRARRCTFSGDNALGAGTGWPALGGAIYNAGILAVESSLFYGNGGTGGDGLYGASPPPVHDPVADNPGGAGGPGGPACGGIFNGGTASLVNCTFVGNHARGGRGGNGGNGGIINEYVPITDPPTPPRWRYGTGGAGGNGGDGTGALGDSTGACFLTNCTFALNWCDPEGGWGGPGGMSDMWRGPGPCGTNGSKVGAISGACRLVNTLLATNTPANGGGCDLGHNLSSDASCGFTNPASLNNTDPRLGSLADNGGPTLTLALLPTSPAIDAADPALSPLFDQRGFPRPVGPFPDIGAFEYGSPAFLQLSLISGTDAVVRLFGIRGQSYSLLTSTNLTAWFLIATNQFRPDGAALFHDDRAAPRRFFRLTLP